jgi:ABC-2 type transport system ATP-binding protein
MIRVDNLSFKYQQRQALRPLSLCLEAGERVAVIGPTGAGKSTLLRCLAASVPLRPGQISVEGFDAHADNTQYRRRIGWLAGHESFWPDLTPRMLLEAVAHWRRLPLKHLHAKLKGWDEMFEIRRFWDKPMQSLSPGQQRKVSLCRLLLLQAPYTLLDDPTDGIDPIDADAFRTALQQWPEPYVIVIATHQESWVDALAKRVIALNAGTVTADLAISTARASAPDYRDIHLVLDTTLAAEDIVEAHTLLKSLRQVKDIEHTPNSHEFLIHSHAAQDAYPALRELILATDWPVTKLKQSAGSLAYLYRSGQPTP